MRIVLLLTFMAVTAAAGSAGKEEDNTDGGEPFKHPFDDHDYMFRMRNRRIAESGELSDHAAELGLSEGRQGRRAGPHLLNTRPPPPPEQLAVYQEFYRALRGEHWLHCFKERYYNNPCLCTLKNYVVCDKETGEIRHLNMQGWHLNGTIPASIGRLTTLESWDLTNNRYLHGSLPKEIGNLTRMGHFAIGGSLGNGLTGTIPVEIGEGWKETIYFLEMTNNHGIHGPLPRELSAWKASKYFVSIEINNLNVSGALPAEWGAISSRMRSLEMRFNDNLSGPFPIEWKEWGNLTHFSFALGIDAPQTFASALPREYSAWTQLKGFTAYNMKNVHGTMPAEWSSWSDVLQILVSRTSVSGTLPSEWSAMKALQTLFLHHTNITGTLPPDWATMADMRQFNLDNIEGLVGSIPDAWASWAGSLREFEVANCSLSGYLPEWLLRGPTENLATLQLGGNRFEGHPLAEPLNLTAVTVLGLEGNRFGGKIHRSFGKRLPKLQLVTMQDQAGRGFSGPLPKSFGELTNLTVVIANGNSLSGHIPSGLARLPGLSVVALAGNAFTGTVPEAFAQSRALTSLVLSQNGLSGEIPAAIAGVPTLTLLDLENNKLQGEIPPFGSGIGANTTIQQLRLRMNRMVGRVRADMLSVLSLEKLTLDRNFFSCELPGRGDGVLFPGFDPNATGELSLVSGNTFACPLPDQVLELDDWGPRYVCGWSRVMGSVTAPASMVALSLALFASAVTLRAFPSAAVTAASDDDASQQQQHQHPPIAVRLERDQFLRFLRSAFVLAVCCAALAGGLIWLYSRADSPVLCRYDKSMTAAYVSGGVSYGTLSALWLALTLCILLFGFAQVLAKLRLRDTAAAGAALAVIGSDEVKQHAGDLLDDELVIDRATIDVGEGEDAEETEPSFELLQFADAEDGKAWRKATPAGLKALRIEGVLPEAVEWKTIFRRLRLAKAGRRRRQLREGLRRMRTVMAVALGLLAGFVPNAIFVMIESGVIKLDSSIAPVATGIVALCKSLVGSQLGPLLAVYGANQLLLPLTTEQGSARLSCLVYMNFVNALIWPMAAAATLDPTCLRDAIVPPKPVEIDFKLPMCTVVCSSSKVAAGTCPNAGGLNGCAVFHSIQHSSEVQAPFEWNPSCASTAISIYGPVFILMFAYAIIANAVWLIQTSELVKEKIASARAYKDRKFPPTPPPPPPKPGSLAFRFAAFKQRVLPAPAPPPPPSLGLVPMYVLTSQHVAIIASFGFLYPAVAVVGSIKLAVDMYVAPLKLEAGMATYGATLKIDGVTGVPPAVVGAVMLLSASLIFFALGPAGMLALPSAGLLFALAVTSTAVLMFAQAIVRRCARAENQVLRRMVALLALVADSGAAASAPMLRVGVDDYVAEFQMWRDAERKAATTAAAVVADNQRRLSIDDDDEEEGATVLRDVTAAFSDANDEETEEGEPVL